MKELQLFYVAGARHSRVQQRQILRDIRQEGMSLEVQQLLAGDDSFLRALLSALQCKLEEACAAQEAALSEASQSKQDCAEALATGGCYFQGVLSATVRHADLV